MRWLLIDEFEKIVKAKSVTASSHVIESEFSIQVLMLEMMAQTAGVLLGAESDFKDNVIFAKATDVIFESSNFSEGDKLKITTQCDLIRREGSWFESSIYLDERLIATGKVMLMSAEAIPKDHKESVTFHKQFMEHFKIRDRVRNE